MWTSWPAIVVYYAIGALALGYVIGYRLGERSKWYPEVPDALK